MSTLTKPISLGLLDSGVMQSQLSKVAEVRDFCPPDNKVIVDVEDQLGHGSALAQVILDYAPGVRLVIARIFHQRLAAAPEVAAAGLDWLVHQGMSVINMSFGLRSDHADLARACRNAVDAGVLLVAASPAVGAAVYPGRYPGVVRVTGDARCQPGEVSWRPSAQADFGACVRGMSEQIIGASVATAYVSAAIARDRIANPDKPGAEVLESLKKSARYREPQGPFSRVPLQHRLSWQGDLT